MKTKTIDSLIEGTENIIDHPKFALTFLLFELFFHLVSASTTLSVFILFSNLLCHPSELS